MSRVIFGEGFLFIACLILAIKGPYVIFFAVGNSFRQEAAIPMDSETHSAEDVAVYARGPMSHLFTGVYEQNIIATAMAYASCVGADKRHCERRPTETSASPTVPFGTSNAPPSSLDQSRTTADTKLLSTIKVLEGYPDSEAPSLQHVPIWTLLWMNFLIHIFK